MNITVIGAGYVGLVAACCLANDGHRVICVEKDGEKLSTLQNGISPISERDMDVLLPWVLDTGRLSFVASLPIPNRTDTVMIAVGTPSLPSGATDLSEVYSVCAELREAVTWPLTVVMKSTVPPGTGIRLIERYFADKPVSYLSNPEFLREGQAISDWFNPSRIIIGANNIQEVEPLKQLHASVNAPMIITDITTAETIKYAANAFLVTKISFINEIANFCELIGAGIDDVAEGLGLDPRIGSHFLRAGVGYGGSCFPKDVRALDYYCMDNGYDFRLLKSCIEVNAGQRVLFVNKLRRLLGDISNRRITLLGLSFKPETDDVRESPAIGIAHLLCEGGADLTVYDPAAMEKARPYLPAGAKLAPNLYTAVEDAQAVCLATEWPDFITANWPAIKSRMQPPYLVLDGRNALQKELLLSLGFSYCGIGRKASYPVASYR